MQSTHHKGKVNELGKQPEKRKKNKLHLQRLCLLIVHLLAPARNDLPDKSLVICLILITVLAIAGFT